MERGILVKATRELLRTNRYSEVSLAAILNESGLHTRAFYRHFETKDDILRLIYLQNRSELNRILTQRVEAATAPMDGVAAWIDEILRLRFEERSRTFIAIYDDPTALEAALADDGEPKRSMALLMEPLEKALEAGRDDGSLPLAKPSIHASFIWSMAWGDLDRLGPLPRGKGKAQAAAVNTILRFSVSGLTGSDDLLGSLAPQSGALVNAKGKFNVRTTADSASPKKPERLPPRHASPSKTPRRARSLPNPPGRPPN
jgi:AcrR family transcriptional regulator